MTITNNPIALRRWLLAAGVVLGSIAAAGCGGDDDDDAAATDDSTETTAASDDGGGAAGAIAYAVESLQYSDVSAPAGGTIEIQNTSGVPHTFTADDGAFDVEYGADETATVEVPTEPGDYAFHCNIHSSMTATLTVQ